MITDVDAADYVAVTLSHNGEVFTLSIENTSEAADVPSPIAPGVAFVHAAGTPLFVEGAPDTGNGLEALAEDGDPSGIAEYLVRVSGVTTPLAPGVAVVLDNGTLLFTAGGPDDGTGLEGLAEDGNAGPYADSNGGTVFAIPSDANEPGPLLPGQSYTVEIEAEAGQNLSLATMLVQSNDWFFSLGAEGIALFDTDGTPVSGDITALVSVWDAGTEIDQTPGTWPDQAPRQAGPDTGADDPDSSIRLVDGYATGDYIQVTITPQSQRRRRVGIHVAEDSHKRADAGENPTSALRIARAWLPTRSSALRSRSHRSPLLRTLRSSRRTTLPIPAP